MAKNPVRIGKVRVKGGVTILPFRSDAKTEAYRHLSNSISRHEDFETFILITVDRDGYFTWSYHRGDHPSIPPSALVDKAKRIIDSMDNPC